ncbi:MAG: Stp1/IreP family PP2C-type Ser/Thr phosphatase [Mogibacterium sp.]|nr:Stp1/IreP family PP2C-type Ser/Thr phosphatase [Mogibacterium sp.]
MKIGFCTDKGRKRPINEDAVKVLPEHRFFMLADGVGGNRAGEVASHEALNALEDYVIHNPLILYESSEEIFRYFENAVNYVNEVIIQLSRTAAAYAGMATTLVFAYVTDKILYVGNVGDSRVYLIHGNDMHQLTIDHTYVNDLVMMGAISRGEAEHHSKKNVITRAIGANAYNSPDCFNIYIEPEDRILLCSDGLYDELAEDEIRNRIRRAGNMQSCAEKLVRLANENGGADNISVICIDLMED